MLAIIGGSGLYELDGLRIERRERVYTPWGEPSDEVTVGVLSGEPVVFLPRHARGHSIAPHRINYRANIDSLRRVGASRIIAVAAVGGIDSACQPGNLVVPDQLIDYTSGRAATFFEAPGDPVVHIDFTQPYDARLRAELIAAAGASGLAARGSGVYGCTNGPRLETAAEIRRLARDGCTVVGMTGMPEAALAREWGMAYACLAVVVNPAAGLATDGAVISMESIAQILSRTQRDVQRLIAQLCSAARSSASNSSSERA